MRRRAVVSLLAALVALASAGAAWTCTPKAEIRLLPPGFDENQPLPTNPKNPNEGPLLVGWFRPGELVAVLGLRQPALANAVGPLTLRWGSWYQNGPIIAQVPIREDTTWEVRFRLPETMQDGTYLLSAVARDTNGDIIGNPGTFTLPVSSKPRESPAEQPKAEQPAPSQPVEQPQREAIVVSPAELPAPLEPVSERGFTPGGAPVERRKVEPRPATKTAREPAREPAAPRAQRIRVAPRPPAPLTRTVVPLARDQVALPHAHEASGAVRFAPAPGIVSAPLPELTAPGAVSGAPVARPDEEAERFTWVVYLLGGLGLLLLGTAAGGFVVARRWPPVAPTDPVEAELQELIAEQRVRDGRRIEID